MTTTVQTEAVWEGLRAIGHGTNQQIHDFVTRRFPTVSLTSVHRITARLLERGAIRLGPSDGRTVVLDATPTVHDHFVCTSCGGIIDLDLPDAVIDAIQGRLGRNIVRDGITIRGHCEDCASTPLHDAT